ncbi:NADPH-dependent FMN reductase [Aegicerativicinus sediminis]|uniref:NADPH-dependent FMN reductase n=1 Tax=Aegicerativicinus sediminis TaxID=2893202 RepID=UPI001E536EAA|nr:NAD(P)H-dependent oxidoreductase [Aegicerativicinus sediminis]
MKKIVVFGGSNSSQSINKKLAIYAANQLDKVEIEVLDLNNYELPIFGVDLEKERGIPQATLDFLEKLHDSDGFVISLAEHNGAYTAAFKNLMDWASRVDGKLWGQKPMLLLATSPGRRGAMAVLQIASNRFPYMGGNIIDTFSLPSFNENFQDGELVHEDFRNELNSKIRTFEKTLFN